MEEERTRRTGWRAEAVGEIAYHIDKFCTGGDENDFPAAEAAVDGLIQQGWEPPSETVPDERKD